MELDITRFVAETDAFQFSASAAELGQDAGRITWNNARDEARDAPLLATADQIEQAREWFKSFGAWDDDERAAWDADDINALLIQFISGDLRELESLCAADNGGIDWECARELSEAGTIGGRIYRGDVPGSDGLGRIFFYLGD